MALVPLYRLQGHGDHFYTISETERDSAISDYGYTSEGIACYVNDTPDVVPPVIATVTTSEEYLAKSAVTILAQLVRGRFHAGSYVGDPIKNLPIDVAQALSLARAILASLPVKLPPCPE